MTLDKATRRHFDHFRKRGYGARVALKYARARVWLDENEGPSDGGVFDPDTHEKCRDREYTGIFRAPEEMVDISWAGATYRKEFEAGRIESWCLFLYIDGEIRDSLGDFQVYGNREGEEQLRDQEVEMVATYLAQEEGVERLVAEGFAL